MLPVTSDSTTPTCWLRQIARTVLSEDPSVQTAVAAVHTHLDTCGARTPTSTLARHLRTDDTDVRAPVLLHSAATGAVYVREESCSRKYHAGHPSLEMYDFAASFMYQLTAQTRRPAALYVAKRDAERAVCHMLVLVSGCEHVHMEIEALQYADAPVFGSWASGLLGYTPQQLQCVCHSLRALSTQCTTESLATVPLHGACAGGIHTHVADAAACLRLSPPCSDLEARLCAALQARQTRHANDVVDACAALKTRLLGAHRADAPLGVCFQSDDLLLAADLAAALPSARSQRQRRQSAVAALVSMQLLPVEAPDRLVECIAAVAANVENADVSVGYVASDIGTAPLKGEAEAATELEQYAPFVRRPVRALPLCGVVKASGLELVLDTHAFCSTATLVTATLLLTADPDQQLQSASLDYAGTAGQTPLGAQSLHDADDVLRMCQQADVHTRVRHTQSDGTVRELVLRRADHAPPAPAAPPLPPVESAAAAAAAAPAAPAALLTEADVRRIVTTDVRAVLVEVLKQTNAAPPPSGRAHSAPAVDTLVAAPDTNTPTQDALAAVHEQLSAFIGTTFEKNARVGPETLALWQQAYPAISPAATKRRRLRQKTC